jgi:PIN domain nuclease of toxin-antitoxin system
MKLLLDTHVWIWSQLAPERLSRRARGRLGAADTELWLSPISVWEVLLLCEKGRIRLTPNPEAWIDAFFSSVAVRDAPLTRAVALLSRRIELEHQDPADRFLAATAAAFDLTLVTADEPLLRGKGYRVLAAS